MQKKALGLVVLVVLASALVCAQERASSAALVPLLEIWKKNLEPQYLNALKDPDPNIRREALKTLFQEIGFGEEHLPLLLNLMKDADEKTAQEAGNLFVQYVGSGAIDRRKAIGVLLETMRGDGLESVSGARALGLLVEITGGGRRGPGLRPPRPGAPAAMRKGPERVATPPGASAEAAELPLFTDADLAFFATGLSSGQEEVRRDVISVLLGAGEPGARTIHAEMAKRAEALQREVIRSCAERMGIPGVSAIVLEFAQGETSTRIRTECRNALLGKLDSAQIPLELLARIANEERGNLRDLAFAKLVSRSVESADLFTQWLKSPETEIAAVACRALIHIGLYLDANDVGTRALAEVRRHFGPDEEGFLLEVAGAFGVTALCEPGLASRVAVPMTATTRSPRPVPAASNWLREASTPHVERLTEFLPVFEKFSSGGGEREKTVAFGLLMELWRCARKLDAEERQRPAGQLPVVAALRSLAGQLEKDAWEAFAAGNRDQFIAKARWAITAGSNAGFRNKVAWALATTPQDNMRDPREGERLAQEALALGGRTPQFLETLAACLAGQGKFKEAIDCQAEALQGLKKEDNLAPLVVRAILYLSEKPYVEQTRGK
jgi:hypothetical protein